MAMRSQSASTWFIWWVERIVVRPFFRRSWSRCCTSRTFTGSSPVVGSSRTHSSGSLRSTAAICTFCDIPLLRRSIFQLATCGSSTLFEPHRRSAPRLGTAETLQRAEIRHHIGDRQLRVKAPLFRKIAETIEMLATPGFAEDTHFARVGADDVHQDPDERALAGAVGTEQAEDFAGVDVERHAAKRRVVAVALRDVVERENHHRAEELTWTDGSAATRATRLAVGYHWLRTKPARVMPRTHDVSSPSTVPRSTKARFKPSTQSRPFKP